MNPLNDEETENTQEQSKTVFNLLSNLKQCEDQATTQTDQPQSSEIDPEIAFLKTDPETNEKFINKSAYLKLHRSLSPNNSLVVDKIKEKYENLNDQENNRSSTNSEKKFETIESIKNKYSPAGLGYNKSRVPIPKPRRRLSLLKSEGILKLRKKEKIKNNTDLNSNQLKKNKLSSNEDEEEDEFLTIVIRSDSEESVNKIQRELSVFTMDKKKRTNSFRKLFSGKIFGGKDKRRISDESDSKKGVSAENNQNEFNRQSPYRHTTGETKPNDRFRESAMQPIDSKERYTFENNQDINRVPHGYVPMDKPIVKSNDPNVYIQVPSNVKKYIDTSSSASASTLESERSFLRNNQEGNTNRNANFNSNFKRDTPPRAMETKQNVELVNPKALMPVTSRLPNPHYNNLNGNYQNIPPQETKYIKEEYSTVFDCIPHNRQIKDAANTEHFRVISSINQEKSRPASLDNLGPSKDIRNIDSRVASPKSPSLEPSKLKLPPNRDIVPLSPRIRSPIPQEHVSAEKIIATELLRPKRSPTPNRSSAKEPDKTAFNPQQVRVDKRYSNSNIDRRDRSQQLLETDLDDLDDRNEISSVKSSLYGKPPSGTRPGIPPKPPIRRSFEDSRSSNELNASNLGSLSPANGEYKRISAASPSFRGYKLDFSSPSSTSSFKPNLNLNESDEIKRISATSPSFRGGYSPSSPAIFKFDPANVQTTDLSNTSPNSNRLGLNSPTFQTNDLQRNTNSSLKNEIDRGSGISDVEVVEMRHKPKITMTKTYTHQGDDHSAARRFYEVGHITKSADTGPVSAPVDENRAQDSLVLPKANDHYSSSKLNLQPSNESLNRITTQASVHRASPTVRTPTPNKSISLQSVSLSPMRSSGSRPTTPLNSRIPESPKTTPQKEEIRKSVEAYYWNEIRKLKDQENYDLYLYQLQYANLIPQQRFLIEQDQIARSSRSMSPSIQRNTRRSLSLPREGRPRNHSAVEKIQENQTPEDPPNFRPMSNSLHQRSLQQIQFQANFTRNSPERSTVDGSLRNRSYDSNSLYRPIFKRGSLSTPPRQVIDENLKRRVSFSRSGENSVEAWPTRNGFTKSPPQRRVVEKLNSEVNSARYDIPPDSIPSSESLYGFRHNGSLYGARNNQPYVMENVYGQRLVHGIIMENAYGEQVIVEDPYSYRTDRNVVVENPYGQRMPNESTAKPQLVRHGSVQVDEGIYGQRGQVPVRRVSHQSNIPVRLRSTAEEPVYGTRKQLAPLRREVILKDEVFGQFGGYVDQQRNNVPLPQRGGGYVDRRRHVVVQPVNKQGNTVVSPSQSVMEYNARVREEYLRKVPPKQITVNNKVCDFYGQIHDADAGQKLQSDGVLMGQLQRNAPVDRNSYSQLPTSFVRNNRLTASANDMYRRVPNVNEARTSNERIYGTNKTNNDVVYGQIYNGNGQTTNVAPSRPLPPIPPNKMAQFNRITQVSDTESSDASEVQRILNSKTKTKKKGLFGK